MHVAGRRGPRRPAAPATPGDAVTLLLEASGLSRRFGPGLLHTLDRAWGLAPDPREPLAPPLRFHSQVDLWARADNTEALLAGDPFDAEIPMRRRDGSLIYCRLHAAAIVGCEHFKSRLTRRSLPSSRRAGRR